MRLLDRVVAMLGGLLLIAVVVSLVARLLRPAIPLVVLLFLLFGVGRMLWQRDRW